MYSKLRLGAFILTAIIAFGFLAFVIGRKQFLFSRTYQIKSGFDSVAGLDEGAPVRAGGVRIGVVEGIQLPSKPDEKVTVQMSLDSSSRKVLKTDSIASIQTEGLLGQKYIGVSFGSQDGDQLRDGDTIQGEAPIDYNDIMKKLSDMVGTADQEVDSSKVAVANINQASGELKSITGKINSGQGTIGALVNDQSLYKNINSTMTQANAGAAAFHDDMEALKHNFLLRGFFKKRGYFDQSELTSSAVTKLPSVAPLKTFTIEGKDLFGGGKGVKLSKSKLLGDAGAFMEKNQFGLAVIEVGTSVKGDKQQDLDLSDARAVVVRQYLMQKFKVDDARLRTLGLGDQSRNNEPSERVNIVIYPPDKQQRAAEANNGK